MSQPFVSTVGVTPSLTEGLFLAQLLSFSVQHNSLLSFRWDSGYFVVGPLLVLHQSVSELPFQSGDVSHLWKKPRPLPAHSPFTKRVTGTPGGVMLHHAPMAMSLGLVFPNLGILLISQASTISQASQGPNLDQDHSMGAKVLLPYYFHKQKWA